jgi:hypothetical protein
MPCQSSTHRGLLQVCPRDSTRIGYRGAFFGACMLAPHARASISLARTDPVFQGTELFQPLSLSPLRLLLHPHPHPHTGHTPWNTKHYEAFIHDTGDSARKKKKKRLAVGSLSMYIKHQAIKHQASCVCIGILNLSSTRRANCR